MTLKVASTFPRNDVAQLLVKCHRRCCVCHRYCGTKIETDHIEPLAQSDDNTIENAIPVCFECHAEIHSYNNEHPRGRKFTPEELRLHRDQWLKICSENPEALITATWNGDVGPIQALVDELEYNLMVVRCSAETNRGALFQEAQFLRAIREGMIAILDEALKLSILTAYVAISRANQQILAEVHQDVKMKYQGTAEIKAREGITSAAPLIDAAHRLLVDFLTSSAETST